MPIFNPQLLVALIFIILGFTTIFTLKNRTNIITTLIIAHLVLILLFSLTITSYIAFKEIVLMLIIYLIVLLFLIINNPTKEEEKPRKKWFFAKLFFIICGAIIIFCVLFSITKYTAQNLVNIKTKTIENQAFLSQNAEVKEEKSRKFLKLQQNLSDNFLLKRSCDIILIITALGSVALLFRRKVVVKG